VADPKKYRDQAAKLRHDVEDVQSPVVKRQMLEIAPHYERLAKSVEASSDQSEP